MNPFSGSLNRIGFLVWSILLIAWVISFGVMIDATKAHHGGAYWLPFRIGWGIVFAIVSLLVLVRRLQNAGLSGWLVILWLVPVFGNFLWLVLFFLPPKKSA